jgi:hypothetical protein
MRMEIAKEALPALAAREEGFASVGPSQTEASAARAAASVTPAVSALLPRLPPVLAPPEEQTPPALSPAFGAVAAVALPGSTLHTARPVTQISPVAPPAAALLPAQSVAYAPASNQPEAENKPVSMSLPNVTGMDALAKIATVFSNVRAHAEAGGVPRVLPFEAIEDEDNEPDFENNPPAVADFIPLDYYCQRSPIRISHPREWRFRASASIMPAMPFDNLAGKLQDLMPKKEVATFFPNTPKAAPKRWNSRFAELAVAALVLATVLTTGVRLAHRIGTETPNVANDVASSAGASSAPAGNSVGNAGGSTGSSAWEKPQSGPIARIRNVIASRAAVEVSDTFHAGMEAWGHSKGLAPGWSRSPDGYVRPGQLALFQPSMKFKDYRMEFFGQIESKSMDWVVRAKDSKNYYAMKFTVIENGLRPFIAVVHYPVINGVAGRRSTTPLDVMVHNNEPYHVDVAVNGSHIETSIEGQVVDRWVEDGVPSGGVGFFAEAGEKSRLYWMKVAKNEDFLGRVCAYLTGSSKPRDIAMLSSKRISQGMNYGIQFYTPTPYGN